MQDPPPVARQQLQRAARWSMECSRMDYLVDISTAWSLRCRHARERARRRLGRRGSAPRDHPVRHRRVGRAAVVRRGTCQSAGRRGEDHADDPRELPCRRIPVTLAAPLPEGWMHARPPALAGSASDHLKRGRATSHSPFGVRYRRIRNRRTSNSCCSSRDATLLSKVNDVAHPPRHCPPPGWQSCHRTRSHFAVSFAESRPGRRRLTVRDPGNPQRDRP